MSEEDDVKKVIKTLGTTFEDFKKANDKRLEEIEKKGSADPILVEKVEKLSKALGTLDALKEDLDKTKTALARKMTYSTADSVKLEEKATSFYKMVCQNRGVKATEDFSVDDMKAYKKSFEEMMRKGDFMSPEALKSLSVGIDPDGGFTVDADTNGRLVKKIFETSPMRQVASQQTIGTDALEGLSDLDEAGFGWVAETAARPETTTPKLAKWRIPVHEIYANPRATQKLLDDSNMNMESWLAGKVADRFGRAENLAFVSGNGVGRPRGFLTYPTGTTIPNSIEQLDSGVNGGFAASPDGGDILFDVIYRLKAAYRSRARWAMNRQTQAEVRKLKDSNGAYIWQPGLMAGNPSTLVGYGISEFEDMPVLATGSLSIAFADWTETYQIVDRAGVRVLRDPYSAKPFVEFYTVKRVGGDVLNFEAIKLINFKV